MTNKEFQQMLSRWPDDMPVRLLPDHSQAGRHMAGIVEFDAENILHTSETAYVDEDAPEEEWDTEDGKVRLGDGQQFLLVNPIVL